LKSTGASSLGRGFCSFEIRRNLIATESPIPSLSMVIERWRITSGMFCGIALVYLVVGTRIVAADEVGTNSNRVFELRVYHVVPGKMQTLEARFRDTTSKLLARHDLKVVGFWVGDDNTFIFLVDHRSKEEAKKNWDAFRADPDFQEMVKSEQKEKLVEKIDSTYMRSTDYSPIK
jgi:NIPSNAP